MNESDYFNVGKDSERRRLIRKMLTRRLIQLLHALIHAKKRVAIKEIMDKHQRSINFLRDYDEA